MEVFNFAQPDPILIVFSIKSLGSNRNIVAKLIFQLVKLMMDEIVCVAVELFCIKKRFCSLVYSP